MVKQILSNLQPKEDKQAIYQSAEEIERLRDENNKLKEKLVLLEDENKTQKQEIDTLKNKVLTLEEEKKEFVMNINELKEVVNRLKLENLNVDKYEEWSMDEIIHWILSIEPVIFRQYEGSLRKMLADEDVNGECLEAVDVSDIKRWGIRSFKHSKLLHQHIRSLVEGKRNKDNVNSNVASVANVTTMNEGSNAPTAYIG